MPNTTLDYLSSEAARSPSGMSLDCASWPGYGTAYRWISRNKIGPWRPTAEEALEAYKLEKDKNFLEN